MPGSERSQLWFEELGTAEEERGGHNEKQQEQVEEETVEDLRNELPLGQLILPQLQQVALQQRRVVYVTHVITQQLLATRASCVFDVIKRGVIGRGREGTMT